MNKKAPMFYIGHNSYTGANAPGTAYSKADAVRQLRDRGAKRDDARAAVNRAATGSHATVTADSEVVEIKPA